MRARCGRRGAEELARIVEPFNGRVTLAGVAGCNLRRLIEVDCWSTEILADNFRLGARGW
jgi:hypothetical protein